MVKLNKCNDQLTVPAASLALDFTKKDLLHYTVGSVFQVTDNNALSAMNDYNPHILRV